MRYFTQAKTPYDDWQDCRDRYTHPHFDTLAEAKADKAERERAWDRAYPKGHNVTHRVVARD